MDEHDELRGEAARRIARRALGAVSSVVPIGIVAVDPEGRSWYHNQRWEDVTGAKGTEFRGKPWYAAVHPDDTAEVAARWEGRSGKRGNLGRFRVRSVVGIVQECTAQSVAIVWPDGSVAGYLVVVFDAADGERLGLPSGNFVEKLLDRSEDIVTILNADGSWRWSSAGAARLLGYRVDFDPKEGIFGLVHPEEVEAARRMFSELTKRSGRSSERLEYRVKGADGTWHRMEAIADVLIDDPEVRGIVLHTRDVTEARRTLAELEASNQWLASLIASIRAPLVMQDERGIILVANQAFVDLFSLVARPEDLRGRTLAAFGIEAAKLVVEPRNPMAGISDAIAERRRDYQDQVTLYDGRIIERDFVPVFVQDVFRGNLWMLRDVTDQVRAERERERLIASEQAEQRRMAELEARQSEYLASVSHELRTPLTSIVGYTDMLRDLLVERGLDEEVRYVDIVARNVGRLFRLSGDLMLLESLESEMTHLEIADVDMAELAGRAVAVAAPDAAAHSVSVEADVEPGPLLRGDAERIGQMLDILVSNAIKYSHPDGRVRVQGHAGGGGWEIDVSDDGIGIPEEEQALLFSRFFRGSNARLRGISGTGLGLSIARAVAQLHGGDITFRSRLGQGTTFHVTLTRADGSRSTSAMG